jgi:hypothetical protein
MSRDLLGHPLSRLDMPVRMQDHGMSVGGQAFGNR